MVELLEKVDFIRQAIRNSPFAAELTRQERWSLFRARENKAEWISLLGPSAIVLSHQEFFTDFVLRCCNDLSPGKMTAIILAATTHDMGEATRGDIAASLKTGADDELEYIAAVQNIAQLKLPADFITELVGYYQEVVMGKNAELHGLFRALERTEYLDTAIHVFHSLQRGELMEKGWLMVSQVITNDLPKIIAFAKEYPSIGFYLVEQRQNIDLMFIQSRQVVTVERLTQFCAAEQMWKTFINS
jgi:hypothetical protein